MGGLQRLLKATAAVLAGVSLVIWMLPALSQLGRGADWRWALAALILLIPFLLLIPAAVWPRSVLAAVLAALPIGFLFMMGLEADPMSWLRFAVHLAAILSLAALVIQVIRGFVDHRLKVLWIVPALLVGLVVGYLAAAYLGFHIRSQFCSWPFLGPDVSSYLCSG